MGGKFLRTWSINLDEKADGTTRVHLRVRGRMSPLWFAAVYAATIVPADLIMARGMLRGLKQRAESDKRPPSSRRIGPKDPKVSSPAGAAWEHDTPARVDLHDH